MPDVLIDVRNIRTTFHIKEGVVPAIEGVSLQIGRQETVAIVGESGCGKSVTALTIMRLIQSPPGRIEQGAVIFEGEDLLKASEKRMRQIRGNDIAMIFQEPMTSLNPLLTVGFQIEESLILHQSLSKQEAYHKALGMLKRVDIPAPEQRMHEYPHQLSGGMRQRVMIAMALSCSPKLLIADEPTTALDVTIQAQIMILMNSLREEMGMAIMLITHDLGVVANMADRVIVMYAGQVVEEAPVNDLFAHPQHPYTQGLLLSVPRLDARVSKLNTISGTVPNLLYLPRGCRFNPRCSYAQERCQIESPGLTQVNDAHSVRCWFPLGMMGGKKQ
ncbi:MAG: peptide/nickel transport system ATP-binding protein [Bacillota bacterium]|nr:MAG: peptide/nickel transport system ATP-binding protein [Bacillota bacterium]